MNIYTIALIALALIGAGAGLLSVFYTFYDERKANSE